VASKARRPPTLPFTIDSALLRELGERLVGRSHIALAELIKNAYDADATIVDVVFGRDSIVVRDNGHGMTYEEFRDYWMRIGSPHKERQEASRTLKRPLTGSKGVGRLAAQFLAHELKLFSTSQASTNEEVVASVDWDAAVQKGDLTQAEADVAVQRPRASYPGMSEWGTFIRMDVLKQEWGEKELRELARELWPLQPPFDSPLDEQEDEYDFEEEQNEEDEQAEDDEEYDPLEDLLKALDAEDAEQDTDEPQLDFQVRLRVEDQGAADAFASQMRRVLDIWTARITGTLRAPKEKGRVSAQLEVAVEFPDGTIERLKLPKRQRIHELNFEVRVFSLHHRQRYRIPVDAAREYLRRYGGVHVYDAGFHLPYYGPDTDWLGIEQDHAHRLSMSKLLPVELNVRRGLNALPTNSRLYGVVEVNTARERRLTVAERRGKDALTIQVSRDRLVQNCGYDDLRELVRAAVDFYAVCETRRMQAERELQGDEPVSVRARRVRDVLENHRRDIAPEAYRALRVELDEVVEGLESEALSQSAQAGLLGSLATAGMTAIAFEHEYNRQLSLFERLARQLRRADDLEEARALADQVRDAVRQARESRRMFSHLMESDEREQRHALRARVVLDGVADQLRHFMRGIKVDHSEVGPDFRLPLGTLAEWGSLFQNLYINAINAMLDADQRRIAAWAFSRGGRRFLIISDTGTGVDSEDSEHLFEPFVRFQSISAERQRMGLGGTGLGLTIVRMLATNLGCEVHFVRADDDYNTAVELSWDVR
jgi:signal transduction histidine kinase